jgi:hypothetical protein
MPRVRVFPLCAVLLLLTAVAYLPVWQNDFVDFDDEVYLTSNPGVLGGLTPHGFAWAWTNSEAPYWIPLPWLSFQLDAQCFAARDSRGNVVLSAAAAHGQNLVWHAASVLLLFRFWDRLTAARWRSFLVAALFAVHPMHVESVAWAFERKDVLSTFFGILTLWAYTRYLEKPGRLRYLGMAAAFLMALLSKPMLITLPFVLLLLDYWPLRRWGTAAAGTEPATPRRLVREKAPLFLLAAVFAALTLLCRDEHGSLVSFGEVPPVARVANALTGYGWYLAATFCPVRLAVLYPHPYRDWSLPGALAGAAVLLCLTGLALGQARRRPWLLVGWVWFVGAVLPVSGLVQGGAQAWADRFSYWPHIGLFVALVWGVAELVERCRVPAAASAAAGTLVLVGLGVLTWGQVGVWRNSQTLWEHAVAVTRDNDRAHERLARCYYQAGRRAEAFLHSREAARIQVARLRRAFPNLARPRPSADGTGNDGQTSGVGPAAGAVQ